MTTSTLNKINEAKKMVAHFLMNEPNNHFIDGLFIPVEYDRMRWEWEMATASWATVKKYAAEIGLKTKQFPIEWHSDGSPLAEMCGIEDGTIFYYTGYYFED